MFKKILIANRGEIACRIIRTAKKMGIRTVAVYSEIDAKALHVQMADESVGIGPAVSAASYLDSEKIVHAAQITHAEAIHPGYGFLSEDSEFAERLHQAGLIFIGPPAEAIRIMGDKNLAKSTVVAAGVPVVPGYHAEKIDLTAMKQAVQKIGLPVLIKASAGGGGKGMRLVEKLEQLAEAVQSAQREAQASFGDSRIFVEKYLAHARHIEVQILFDQYGKGIHLFDRDCSIQRRHQKVIEEAPAINLSESTRLQMVNTALRAGEAIHYCNAGTIEFLLDEDESFYFMEMNTRLQVEHPITEMITGLDLVEWQLRIAAGEHLTLNQTDIKIHGHAVEARLYAENPQNNFMPSAGTLRFLQLPDEQLPAIRVDSGVQMHDKVSIYYDPLLAKLVAWGENRPRAIKILQQILNNTAVVGIQTNWTLLNRIAHNPDYLKGKITTHFIADHPALLESPSIAELPDEVIVAACLTILKKQQAELQQFQQQSTDPDSPWFKHDNWRLNQTSSSVITLWQGGKLLSDQPRRWQINVSISNSGWRLQWDEHVVELTAQNRQEVSALVFPEENQITVFYSGNQWLFSLTNPAATADASQATGNLHAPMPGTLIEICVEPGQAVTAGQRLLVMEAMKMEHALVAPRDGKIQTIFYKPGDRVNEGTELIAFTN